MIAHQLISLLPDSRPLSLVVRLIFCLKPTNEDWEHPDLYSDLDNEDEMYSIANLVQFISRPITTMTMTMFRSTVSPARIIDFLSFEFFIHNNIQKMLSQQSADDAYYIAKLLSNSAPQVSVIRRVRNSLCNSPKNHIWREISFAAKVLSRSNLEMSYAGCVWLSASSVGATVTF